MSSIFPAPFSPEQVHELERQVAEMRAAALRAAFKSLGRKLAKLASPVTRRISDALARRRVLDELEAMSDRELADIGLARSDLHPRRFEEIGSDETLARNQPRTRPAQPSKPANENLRVAA
ncbi:MAG: DUF1127 domain-containing protein [Rhodospirillales bacterium]|nr:DUF1127 domain-containing protein [Rhodospirillales bacterium]